MRSTTAPDPRSMPTLVGAGKAVFWWGTGGLVAVVLGTLPRLPLVVASHFGGSGAPNGWSGRTAYVVLVLVIGVGIPAGVIGLVYQVTALTAGVITAHFAVLSANAARPPHLSATVIVPILIAIVAAIGAWAVGWYRLFHPPVP